MINSVRYSTTRGEVADNDNRKHPHAAARVARADRSDQAPQDHRRDQEGGIPFPPSRPWRSATNSSSSTVRTGPKPTSTAIDLRSEPASTTSPSARKYQAGATPYPAMQQRNWLTYSSPWTLSVRRNIVLHGVRRQVGTASQRPRDIFLACHRIARVAYAHGIRPLGPEFSNAPTIDAATMTWPPPNVGTLWAIASSLGPLPATVTRFAPILRHDAIGDSAMTPVTSAA